ncbi:MAG: polysaccharide deacetylase family protein [Gemmatimonas sp.]|nr:polysaccharide deacetylase family protein [Gemmatimonas sp.]
MNATPDILTIDVEEWFHGHNYLDQAPPDTWEGRESRVVANTGRCLDLLAKHRVTGTFFVLGWTAERHPDLVRRIAAAGHEIACHSYAHPVVHRLSPDEFRADLSRARAALAAAGVERVAGYRAPSFTITPPVHGYLHLLREAGFTYDCSLFPVHHPHYGQPASPRRPFLLQPPPDGDRREPLLVMPMTTARVLGVNVGFAGGAYLRLLPAPASRGLRALARRQGQPIVTYLHPWELDDWRPGRIGQSPVKRLLSQGGQNSTFAKLEGVLRGGNFVTMGEHAALLRRNGGLPTRTLPLA